uniref:Uncharacterized protein n=1 Tax=Megaselia scalaris TaxID=36166 RepID=T1GC16_MEGSC
MLASIWSSSRNSPIYLWGNENSSSKRTQCVDDEVISARSIQSDHPYNSQVTKKDLPRHIPKRLKRAFPLDVESLVLLCESSRHFTVDSFLMLKPMNATRFPNLLNDVDDVKQTFQIYASLRKGRGWGDKTVTVCLSGSTAVTQMKPIILVQSTSSSKLSAKLMEIK